MGPSLEVLEVRAKRTRRTRGEHGLFRLQEIKSNDVTLARSLPAAFVSMDLSVDENELFLVLCEFLPMI